MEIVKTDEGHQEYYFKQLTEEEQRVYREILNGIRREEQFYLTLAADDSIDRTYHAVREGSSGDFLGTQQGKDLQNNLLG